MNRPPYYPAYLARDLQRLLAKFILPVSPDWKEHRGISLEQASRLAVYQELVGQSFGALLAWSWGKSIIQRHFTADQIVKIHDPMSDIHLRLQLGLMDDYLPQTAYIHEWVQEWAYSFPEEVVLWLHERGHLVLEEKLGFRMNSRLVLARLVETGGQLNLYSYISYTRWLGGNPDLLDIYLTHGSLLTMVQFKELWDCWLHRDRVLPLEAVRAKLPPVGQWSLSETQLINLIYLFPAATRHPVADFSFLQDIVAAHRYRLQNSTWEKIFTRCLHQMLDSHQVIEPAIYSVFFGLLLQHRVRRPAFSQLWEKLEGAPNATELKEHLRSTLQAALQNETLPHSLSDRLGL